MVLLKILIVIAAFIAGYFVGSNNPTKSVIQKIKDKL
jgi:hypothetical protein